MLPSLACCALAALPHTSHSVTYMDQGQRAEGLADLLSMASDGSVSRSLLLFAAGTAVGSAIAFGVAYAAATHYARPADSRPSLPHRSGIDSSG